MTWQARAAQLATEVTPAGSRWREPVTSTPRHLFVPRWWDAPPGAEFGHWELHDGAGDEGSWFAAAYGDQTLITEVAGKHADHAHPGDLVSGRPTSSATLPSLVVRMLRHGEVYAGARVLDVATGSGYSAALLARLLGDDHVTSIDVESYLVEAASARLDAIGLHPTKTADGKAVGHIARDWAMFMPTRSGGDYPPRLHDLFDRAQEETGEQVSRGRYPVVDAGSAWELRSMLEVMTSGGIQHGYEEGEGGRRTALLVHADGSWARADTHGAELPEVHQSGPRRLWDLLDDIREYWLVNGALPVHGARVFIQPDGAIRVARGGWRKVVR